MAETVKGGLYWVHRRGKLVPVNANGEPIDIAELEGKEPEPSTKQPTDASAKQRTS